MQNEFDEIDRFFAIMRYNKDRRRFGSQVLQEENKELPSEVVNLLDAATQNMYREQIQEFQTSKFIELLEQELSSKKDLTQLSKRELTPLFRLIVIASHLFPTDMRIFQYRMELMKLIK